MLKALCQGNERFMGLVAQNIYFSLLKKFPFHEKTFFILFPNTVCCQFLRRHGISI
jgi:hypothetical protein